VTAVSHPDGPAARASAVTGLAVVFALLVIYGISNPIRTNVYDHFVWQASAWLEGQAGIRYPVTEADGLGATNDYYQDVLPILDADGQETGRALIPFPPLPAVVLLPFVAVFGLATDEQFVATVLGALVVGVVFFTIRRLPVRPAVQVATTVLFGLGTIYWYAAQLGSTWYLAHIVAVGLTFLAIAVALGADPRAPLGAIAGDAAVAADAVPIRSRRWPLDPRQVLAGLLIGLAATSRLTVIFALPFLVFVGGGGSWLRRGLAAGLGASIPVAGLLAYNMITTGHWFHPGYEYLYQVEIGFYPRLFPYLEYHRDWAIEDVRYIPQNLRLMLFGLPEILPRCAAGAARIPFDVDCPFIRPRADGMSILLTTPALVLALPPLRLIARSRLVAGAALAVVAVAVFNLMHFSQGWVQFGYRFALDFWPFLLLLVALGMERVGGVRRSVVVLIAVSVAVVAWGVIWGNLLGW
jgi:hypothetical protein